MDPNKPFILRVDLSGYAVGAVLEQTARTSGMPTVQDAFSGKTTPVAFMSRKLSTSQERTWDIRDKETYAVVAALEKWSSWIGLQPVLILTDHKSLDSWYHEISQDPMGPSGRRARWHQKLSRFKLEVVYIKGKDNTVADALSRWAYPASQYVTDVSWHGSANDHEEMQLILAQEKSEEKVCPAFCDFNLSR